MEKRQGGPQVDGLNVLMGTIALLGIAQFLALSAIAMRYYPGGYSLTHHFLSDLGRCTTAGGENNLFCSAIFSRSAIVLGLSLIPFSIVMPEGFAAGRTALRLSGCLSALGLIGIGLTPYDQYFVLHHVALGFWVAPLLAMVLIFCFAARSAGSTSVSLVIGTLVLVLAGIIYACGSYHVVYVVMQKVVVVLAVCWFCLVLPLVSFTATRALVTRREITERQARQYLSKLQQGHRKPGKKKVPAAR